MSLHKSLVSRAALERHRNVLTRAERIKKLREEEKWQDGRSVFGLPKVRNLKLKKKSKVKKVAEGAEAAEGEAATEAVAEKP